METDVVTTDVSRLSCDITSSFANEIRRFAVSATSLIVVEVDEKTEVDWPGVAALFSLTGRARRLGGTVKVHGTCLKLNRMLRAQGLDRLILGATPRRGPSPIRG
jgi:hypothetical protein